MVNAYYKHSYGNQYKFKLKCTNILENQIKNIFIN